MPGEKERRRRGWEGGETDEGTGRAGKPRKQHGAQGKGRQAPVQKPWRGLHGTQRDNHICTQPHTHHPPPPPPPQLLAAYDATNSAAIEASSSTTTKPKRPANNSRYVFPATIAGATTITADRAKTTFHVLGREDMPIDVTLWRADTAAAPQAEDLCAAPRGTVFYICCTFGRECTPRTPHQRYTRAHTTAPAHARPRRSLQRPTSTPHTHTPLHPSTHCTASPPPLPLAADWEGKVQGNVNDDGFIIISADKTLNATLGAALEAPPEAAPAGQTIEGAFAVDTTVDTILK